MKTATQKLLTAAVVLQGMIIAGQWFGSAQVHARGENNLPDPGARQLQIIDELKTLSAKVDRLSSTLTSGEVKVKVQKDEK